MVTRNQKRWADQIKRYRLCGLSENAWSRHCKEGYKHSQVLCPGFKYNMTDIQASIEIHQLKRVDENLKRRNQIWQMYDEGFSDLPLILPAPEEPDTVHARHLYTVLMDTEKTNITRNQFQNELYQMNIGSGIHFQALHTHEFYKNAFSYKKGDFPNAEFVSDRTLSLPLSAQLTDEDVGYVIETVREILK